MAKCLRPVTVRQSAHSSSYIQVPCGRCINCLRRRQRDWTFRIKMEQKQYLRGSFFITLTYAPEHVPITNKGNRTLVKRDLQLFIKRLRKSLSANSSTLRYYACGEYGDKFNRPHYHAILFISDTERWLHTNGCDDIGKVLNEKYIQKHWPFGFTKTSFFTDARAGYVAKYSVKKLGQQFDSEDTELVPPFALMSTRPAIGLSFVSTDKGKELIKKQQFLYYDYDGNVYYLPRYLREKMFTDYQRSWNSFLVWHEIEMQESIEYRLHPHTDVIYWRNKIMNDMNAERQLMQEFDSKNTLLEFYQSLKNEK